MLPLLLDLPLVRLLRRGSTRFNLEMAAIIVFAGLTNAGLLAIINAAAENARNEAANGRLLLMFGVTIGLYIYCQRFILFASITEVERLLGGIRIQVADRIRKADLAAIEHLGRSDIYGIVSRELQSVSQAAGTLIVAAQSIMMVLFTVIYLSMLSWTAFIVTIFVTWIALVLHFKKAAELNRMMAETQVKENQFLGSLSHLLDGFKEMRMSRARSSDIFNHVRMVSKTVEDAKTRISKFSIHRQPPLYRSSRWLGREANTLYLPLPGEALRNLLPPLSSYEFPLVSPHVDDGARLVGHPARVPGRIPYDLQLDVSHPRHAGDGIFHHARYFLRGRTIG